MKNFTSNFIAFLLGMATFAGACYFFPEEVGTLLLPQTISAEPLKEEENPEIQLPTPEESETAEVSDPKVSAYLKGDELYLEFEGYQDLTTFDGKYSNPIWYASKEAQIESAEYFSTFESESFEALGVPGITSLEDMLREVNKMTPETQLVDAPEVVDWKLDTGRIWFRFAEAPYKEFQFKSQPGVYQGVLISPKIDNNTE